MLKADDNERQNRLPRHTALKLDSAVAKRINLKSKTGALRLKNKAGKSCHTELNTTLA
jgi:hypothetical protein